VMTASCWPSNKMDLLFTPTTNNSHPPHFNHY
jgi:hypothetical protein